MRSYAICGFMGWFSNMAFMQYFSSNRSFFIVFDQYSLIFTPFDICAAPKLRAQLLTSIPEPVRNRFKNRCLHPARDFGKLSRAAQAEEGAIERINKGKKAIAD